MRQTGVLDEDDDTLRHTDHVCWVHDEPASSTAAARRFLTQGLARGERPLGVGGGLAEGFRAAGEPCGPHSDLVARGALDADAIADLTAVHPQVHAPQDLPSLAGFERVDVAGARVLARWAGTLADRGTVVHLRGAPAPLLRLRSPLGLGDRAPVVLDGPA